MLDTHTLLWFLSDSPELPKATEELICTVPEVYVSCVTLWEIAIKKNLGKLKFDNSVREIIGLCARKNIMVLPMDAASLDRLSVIPFIHKDPFDRYLVACAIEKDMVIVTRDSIIPKYDVQTLWRTDELE